MSRIQLNIIMPSSQLLNSGHMRLITVFSYAFYEFLQQRDYADYKGFQTTCLSSGIMRITRVLKQRVSASGIMQITKVFKQHVSASGIMRITRVFKQRVSASGIMRITRVLKQRVSVADQLTICYFSNRTHTV